MKQELLFLIDEPIQLPETEDTELLTVCQWFLNQTDYIIRVSKTIRDALDAVLDGVHTGRFDINSLDKNEKTYIGFKVENLFLYEFHLKKALQGPDTIIEKIPVDIKFSLTGQWMIPKQHVGHICIVLSANDKKSLFNFGVIRAKEEWLNQGRNQDKKRSLSTIGKENIIWLGKNVQLPENILLHMNPNVRNQIISIESAQVRVNELFKLVQNKPISTTVVDTIARQRDASKRVRDARLKLTPLGIEILQGHWKDDQEKAEQNHILLRENEWVSIIRNPLQ